MKDGESQTRRAVLQTSLVAMASVAAFQKAHAMVPIVGDRKKTLPVAGPSWPSYTMDREEYQLEDWVVHHGEGKIGVKYFEFAKSPAPNLLFTYVIYPGCSEGTHVHNFGDEGFEMGPYDEYYYILEGCGVMTLGDKIIPVTAGDHIHTPLGLHHGIKNTHTSKNLKVFLLAVDRTTRTETPTSG